MKKVSIIIPIYNAEKYLNECLESIVNQTYKNIEVILIDDGSIDKSPYICEKYSQAYDNVFAYHITNGGVSRARNYGIDKSTGDFIVFIDSDDYIDKSMIEKLINSLIISKADIVICGYSYLYTNRLIKVLLENKIYNQDEAIKELYKDNSIQGYSVNKIYKKNIIENNKIRFNTDIKISEDMLFVFEYLLYSNKIYTIPDSLYYYRMRKSSASNFKNENDLSVFKAYDIMENLYPKSKEYMINNYYYCFFKYRRNIKKYKLNNIKKISILSLLLNRKISKKTKIYSLYYYFIPNFIRLKLKIYKQNNGYFD